jgi:hypothetical protein
MKANFGYIARPYIALNKKEKKVKEKGKDTE